MTQDEFIAILFIDCGIETATQRKNYIFSRTNKNYPDELNAGEKSLIITTLQALKRHNAEYASQPEND